ncbi:MAG: bifunctional metallophosphatase/5'-nucleotidase, partial [Candidatus Cloacimonetes bacterium]|nr:bifunctional metallophosphatase/5'-nucleotidase [Candidatus Cloacimonadota bacterium]
MKKSLVVLLLIGLGIIYAIPLRILYTNDSHGSHLPRTYTIEGQKTELGGYASLEHHLSRERSSATRSIYLDAGDQQTGTIFSSLEHDGAIGGAVIKVFNHLGLEATCYGNHEFDINPENTRKLSQLARYPFLSTNIIERKTASHFPVKPYHIITQDSLSIGLMGLTMTDL